MSSVEYMIQFRTGPQAGGKGVVGKGGVRMGLGDWGIQNIRYALLNFTVQVMEDYMTTEFDIWIYLESIGRRSKFYTICPYRCLWCCSLDPNLASNYFLKIFDMPPSDRTYPSIGDGACPQPPLHPNASMPRAGPEPFAVLQKQSLVSKHEMSYIMKFSALYTLHINTKSQIWPLQLK